MLRYKTDRTWLL